MVPEVKSMTIQEIKKYLKKHNLLTFEYGSEFYSIERSHSLFCTQYSLLDTDALPQRRDSLEKLCEQVYIGNGVLLSEAIHSIGIPEPDDSSWKTYKSVLHSAIVCGNEIHFFFRGKGYWIAYADDGKAHLSDNTGNTQWFDSCRALFNDARIDGYALEDIWGEVIVDSC